MNATQNSGEVMFRIGGAADLRVIIQGMERHSLLSDIGEMDRKLVATIASELGANIVKYAGRGSLRICRAERMHALDLDVWAEDQGPGIEDIDRAMSDSFSTGGTLGLGLPGVKRMADEFWIRSQRGQGTLVFARKTIRRSPSARSGGMATPGLSRSAKLSTGKSERYSYAVALRPYPGNPFCGDAACVLERPEGCLMAIVDASGHGRAASQVAHTVTETLMQHSSQPLSTLFQRVHDALQATAGAALGLMLLDASRAQGCYAAIGNTRVARLSGQTRWTGIARDGVLGSRLPTLQVQEFSLQRGDRIGMWTDGIPDFDGRKLVEQHRLKDPKDLAALLVQDLGRPYDDACCLVLDWNG